ncbi:MAG: hypothetical protein OXC28_20465 [Defluviicoccus sp.]|nr:hypothetical protein [Defluviicoccus sp.]
MTEFETATLALREAALWTAIAHVAVALLIGLGQIAIVYYGISEMKRIGAQQAVETGKRDKADKRRHKAEKRRHAEAMAGHAETMVALQELIRRTARPQAA